MRPQIVDTAQAVSRKELVYGLMSRSATASMGMKTHGTRYPKALRLLPIRKMGNRGLRKMVISRLFQMDLANHEAPRVRELQHLAMECTPSTGSKKGKQL